MEQLHLLHQFSGSISGTVGGINTFDIVQFDNKERIYVFKRDNRKSFHLTVIQRIPYNHKEFDKLLQNPEKISSDCNIFGGWRSCLLKNPEFMPDDYYYNIKFFYEKMLKSKNDMLWDIQRKTKEFFEEIDSKSMDNGIRNY